MKDVYKSCRYHRSKNLIFASYVTQSVVEPGYKSSVIQGLFICEIVVSATFKKMLFFNNIMYLKVPKCLLETVCAYILNDEKSASSEVFMEL